MERNISKRKYVFLGEFLVLFYGKLIYNNDTFVMYIMSDLQKL